MCWKNQFTKLPKEKLSEMNNFFETSKKNSNDQYTGLLHLQIQRKSGKFKKETQNKETIKQERIKGKVKGCAHQHSSASPRKNELPLRIPI